MSAMCRATSGVLDGRLGLSHLQQKFDAAAEAGDRFALKTMADRAPADKLNEIIWKMNKGFDSKMPATPQGIAGVTVPKTKDDDDDEQVVISRQASSSIICLL